MGVNGVNLLRFGSRSRRARWWRFLGFAIYEGFCQDAKNFKNGYGKRREGGACGENLSEFGDRPQP